MDLEQGKYNICYLQTAVLYTITGDKEVGIHCSSYHFHTYKQENYIYVYVTYLHVSM